MELREIQGVWQGVLGQIKLSVSSGNFNTWFAKTQLLNISKDEAVIGVINIFIKQQLETKFNQNIREALDQLGHSPREIRYDIITDGKKTKINRETTAGDIYETESTDNRQESTLNLNKSPLNKGGINPRYTFKNFVPGTNSDLAYTAAQTVSKYPGEKYNPLYIYGGVGLGKTHLMQAIGNEILGHAPDAKVIYINTDTFVNEFVDFLRTKKQGFSSKYRTADVLIVDDMQFIANKEKIQEEFFHIFNQLHQNNKQIIISSDKPPKSIPTLTERLRSRFEMGMMIDIQLPDFETRSAIITSKAQAAGFELEHEVINFLATNIKTNVRELEGILNQLLATAEMKNIDPDLTLAEELLSSTRRTRPQHLTPKQVIDKTAKHFAISNDDICSSKRDKTIVVPRQIAMYLMRSELHMSFPKIALELGRTDHTTALHSINKIDKAIKLDSQVREHVSIIREKLYA